MRTLLVDDPNDPQLDPKSPEFNPMASFVPPPVAPATAATPAAAQPQTHTATSQPQGAPDSGAPEQEESTLAESDATYYGIYRELPSRMAFYRNDKLSARPMGLSEKFKLGAATKSSRLSYVVEAVGACLDRPVTALTLMDFWFVCYWLRTMSYQKAALTITWSCEHPDHFRKVLLGEIARDTLVNQHMIERTDLQVVHIDADALRPVAEELAEMGVFITAPTVADFLERVENGHNWDDEFSFIADLAVYLRADAHGKTIGERVKFMRGLTAHSKGTEIMALLLDVRSMLETAGLKESFTATCKHCRTAQEVSVEVDLLTFFPFGV